MPVTSPVRSKTDRRKVASDAAVSKRKLRAKQAFALARWQGPLLQYRDFLLTGGVARNALRRRVFSGVRRVR